MVEETPPRSGAEDVYPRQKFDNTTGATHLLRDNTVQKIWNLCHILRGDGVSYHQYISELTYLLFLKIAAKNDTEKLIPDGCRWNDIVNFTGG